MRKGHVVEVGTAILCMSGLLLASCGSSYLEDIKAVLEDLLDSTMVMIGEEGVDTMIVEAAMMVIEGTGMIGGIGMMTGVDIAEVVTTTGILDAMMIDTAGEMIEAPGKIALVATLLQRGGPVLLNGMQRLVGNDAID
jgi:hypothetical protein